MVIVGLIDDGKPRSFLNTANRRRGHRLERSIPKTGGIGNAYFESLGFSEDREDREDREDCVDNCGCVL